MKDRIAHYTAYHVGMMNIGDCDPHNMALEYIADRFELNSEQRFWLSFLFQSCYSATTAFYVLNEFPDYENVDIRRFQKWWNENKKRLLFQTDRTKVRNFDKFIPMFESYRQMVGKSQKQFFESMVVGESRETYDVIYKRCSNIYYIGRFSLFLYLESIYRLTNLPMTPTGLDLPNAESCRNGLCYVLGLDDWVRAKLTKEQYQYLDKRLDELVTSMMWEFPELPIDHWNVETSLCAYKKLYWKTRYLGYYIDRQQEEIAIMEKNVPEGVCWDVLWQFRKEYFNHKWLGELHDWSGIRKSQMGLPSQELLLEALNQSYKKKVEFKGLEEVYTMNKKIEY